VTTGPAAGSIDGLDADAPSGSSHTSDELHAATARLAGILTALGPVVVAFSGGADSAFLARMAHDTLGSHAGGPGATVVTAVSASLAPAELDHCAQLAAAWGLDWHQVVTTELDDPDYVRNDGDRCARCKVALMDAVEPMATAIGATVVLGVNVDDLGDHRPGQAAAAQRGARFPLVEAGFTKDMVRAASRLMGLETWDRPAAACLSSRLPYGTPVTMGRLQQVADAEAALHALGLVDLRVRHYGDTARIEVPLAHLDRVVTLRAEVVRAVQAAGYRYVTVDLEGLRSGNLNNALEL
jgi:pyridinium-3,5-biscarboxylic acid mononucleotide sulfurtransferase